MKCLICGQAVVKFRKVRPGTLWVRCITDGDFTIAEDAAPMLCDLPLATLHLVLNAAIIDRQPPALPFIDNAAIVRGCMKAKEIAA